MKMEPVTSSNVTHIGHDGKDMRVTYKGGTTYHFKGVSKAAHDKLMKSESKGSHLAKMGIKGVKLEKPDTR